MPAPFETPQLRPQNRDEAQAGFAALQKGDTEGAREHFIALLEEQPDMALAHLGLGRVYVAEGDHRRGLEHFQEAIALQPDLAPAHFFSGEAREKLGEIEEAMADYDQAIALDPRMPLSYLRKARLLRGNREEARKLLEEGIRRNPQDGALRMALANLLARAGGAEQGEAELRRVVELQPDMWLAHFRLGTSLLQSRQFGPARDALARAAKLAPDNTMVQQALGAALSGLGEHTRAAKAYDDALKLDPSNMRALIGAAMARSAGGRHQEALDVLRRAGRRGNRLPPLQKALGDIYLAMGRDSEAVDVYRAMILNGKGMASSSPELLDLANTPDETDPADYARRLQKAIAASMQARNERAKADPQKLRERLMSRRQRQAG